MSNPHSVISEIEHEVQHQRKSQYPINPIFLNRWSPRAYANREVSDQDLMTVLEAAHWAPSSFNDQPWRLIYAKTEEQLAVFHRFLSEFNLTWAAAAPVLILVATDPLRPNGDPNGAHSFDGGAAWGYMALQAKLLGLVTHAMGGFDREKARSLLNIPDNFQLHAVIALGYQGDKNQLPSSLQEREVPNGRRPLEEVIFEGTMKP
jgi:nitroreductase